MAPQKLKNAETPTTAVVVPAHITMVPMQSDRINCARNTMLLTIAMSVPIPRTTVPNFGSPASFSSN